MLGSAQAVLLVDQFRLQLWINSLTRVFATQNSTPRHCVHPPVRRSSPDVITTLRRPESSWRGVPASRATTRSCPKVSEPSPRCLSKMGTTPRGTARITTCPIGTTARLDHSICGRLDWDLNISTALSVATPASGRRLSSKTSSRLSRHTTTKTIFSIRIWRTKPSNEFAYSIRLHRKSRG